MNHTQRDGFRRVEHLSDILPSDRLEGLTAHEITTGQTWVWDELGFWRPITDSDYWPHWG